MRLNFLPLTLTVALLVAASAGGTTIRAPEVVVGMPFDGRWAYNVERNPPYNDRNSSYPAVHALYSEDSDWSTDLYAKEGTQVKLLLLSSGAAVRIERRSTGDSCGPGVGGSRVSYNVYAGNSYVGWVSFSHVDNPRTTPPFSNGMVVGTVTSERTRRGCYEARHIHLELSNGRASGHACWSDYRKVGTLLPMGAPLGRLGSQNSGRRQRCEALTSSAGTGPMTDCGPLPIRYMQPVIGAPTLHPENSQRGAPSGPSYWGCSVTGERRLPGAGRTNAALDFWCRLPNLDQIFRDAGKLGRRKVRIVGAVDAYLTPLPGPDAPSQLIVRGRHFVAAIYLHTFPVPLSSRTFIPVPKSWLLAAGRIVANKTNCPP